MALDSNSNGNMVMPVSPMYGGGNGGFGNMYGGDYWWIVLLILFAGGWNNGFGNGFGGAGNMALGYDFPWLLNGQSGINNNTNNGFQFAMLNDGVTSIRDGISGISNQLCGGFAGVTASVTNAQNALAQQMYADQIAALERSYNAQTAVSQGMNNIQSQLAQCCCDQRLATCQTQNIVQNEGNATRFADANNTRDIIDAQTRGTQAILDKLCSLELSAKDDTIAQLRQELTFAKGQASQIEQTATLRQGQEAEVDALYNRLSNCPVPTTPVYGRTPIFTCNQNQYGCGCGM